MNKKICIFSSFLVTFLLLLPMSSVSADKTDKFIDVMGNISVEAPATQIPSFAGNSGNIIVELVGGNVEWSGGIVGEASYTGSRWVRSKKATITYNIYTFDQATVDEKTGGLCIVINIMIVQPDPDDPLSARSQGNWRIMSGTGELAGIHGEGTFTFFVGYSGQVHFDP